MGLGDPSDAWWVVFWVFLGGDLVDRGDPYRMVLGILVFLVFLFVMGSSGQGRPICRVV